MLNKNLLKKTTKIVILSVVYTLLFASFTFAADASSNVNSAIDIAVKILSGALLGIPGVMMIFTSVGQWGEAKQEGNGQAMGKAASGIGTGIVLLLVCALFMTKGPEMLKGFIGS